MKVKKGLAIGAAVLALSAVSCTNPVSSVIDYVKHGSRKAKSSHYRGVEWVMDFKTQVTVGDNFVEVGIGKFKAKSYTFSVEENEEIIHTEIKPILTWKYIDSNKDGQVDEYHLFNNKEGKNVVSIYSKSAWDNIYESQRETFGKSQKYAGKKLQKIIDEDYEFLRKNGIVVDGKAFHPKL